MLALVASEQLAELVVLVGHKAAELAVRMVAAGSALAECNLGKVARHKAARMAVPRLGYHAQQVRHRLW